MRTINETSKPAPKARKTKQSSPERDAFFEAMPGTADQFMYDHDSPAFDHDPAHEELEAKAKVTAMITLAFAAFTVVVLSLALFGAITMLER